MPDQEHWEKTPPGHRSFVPRDQFAQLYGASQEDLNKVKAFAQINGFTVTETNPERRQVIVSGTVAQMNEAFKVDLNNYESAKQKYRGYEGHYGSAGRRNCSCSAGKKSDASAPGNARIVLRLFTSALGGGCRHGRMLLAEIRKLVTSVATRALAKFLSPWLQPKAETRRAISAFPDASQLESTTSTGSRQMSPQVAAALLSNCT
jgi:hypothetical protein